MTVDWDRERELTEAVRRELVPILDKCGLFRVMGALADECRERQFAAAQDGGRLNTVWQCAGEGLEVAIGRMTNDRR